jgi:tRNA threonylcarbamoyladenosine biosynthesis protein TsaB
LTVADWIVDLLILALDTSSAAGSAAVTRDGAVLAERAGDGSRHHGERLPRELMDVLDSAGAAIRDVDRFAICTGPGSYTGLRVGIATMQGLALAQRKQLVPVSAFDALTDLRPPSSVLQAVWIDARRGEVFASLSGADGRGIVAPSSLSPDATLAAWTEALKGHARIRFTGDGAIRYADAIRTALGDRADIPASVPMLAATIAQIAAANPDRALAPHAVVPLYVRRTDVELARDRRAARE